MWFDSHCHLDAPEFFNDLDEVVDKACQHRVKGMLIPAVQVEAFDKVAKLAQLYSSILPMNCYTLGIHPLYTDRAQEADIDYLEQQIEIHLNHPRFVGIGEIGLDYFVDHLDNEKQEWFFDQQLRLAKKFELPVILHVRRSQDQILKRLRSSKLLGGIAHAFNGSFVQAEAFLKLNFKLGVGGSMTYERALQIRRLVCELPISSFVLETDAPDIPPAWLVKQSEGRGRNTPFEIAGIASVMSTLRSCSLEELSDQLWQNTLQVLPRLAALNSSIR